MKKAILVISFGTTYEFSRKQSIDAIEEKIRITFPLYEVRKAFTSHKIIKILKARDGIDIDTPEAALEKLRQEKFEEVIVQPLHIIPGDEYESILNAAHSYRKYFYSMEVGRPVLFSEGNENAFNDYDILIDILDDIIPENGATILAGHGTANVSNNCYLYLEQIFRKRGYYNVYLANLEGYPFFKDVIKKLDCSQKITIIPLLLAAGKHVKKDIAGNGDASWMSILKRNGFTVSFIDKGLGEYEKIQDIYLKHIHDAINKSRGSAR